MKILHTSDLHLGHTFYSYDRTVEQTGCLAQIENIIKEQKPDAYVISGDIYPYDITSDVSAGDVHASSHDSP